MKIKTGLWMKIPQLLRLRMLAAAIEQQKERKKNRRRCAYRARMRGEKLKYYIK
jgi:hypothetical protein